jgi:hypothetical protein
MKVCNKKRVYKTYIANSLKGPLHDFNDINNLSIHRNTQQLGEFYLFPNVLRLTFLITCINT